MPDEGAAGLGPPIPFWPQFQQAGQFYRLDPLTLASLAATETGGTFRPDLRSAAGAQGLMQLMPQYQKGLGVTNPMDPSQSIWGGARALSDMLRWAEGRTGQQGWPALQQALMGYNAGPNPARWNNPETQGYPRAFLNYYQQLQQRANPVPNLSGPVGAAAQSVQQQAPQPPPQPAFDPNDFY